MPLSRLSLLISLTHTLQPNAACPVHLHTRTVHSFTDICLAPASGQVVFQARYSSEETDNNPSPWGAETLPEARGTAPVAEPRPCPPQPPAGPAGAPGPDAFLSEHPPSSKKAPLWTHRPSAPASPCPVSFSAQTTIWNGLPATCVTSVYLAMSRPQWRKVPAALTPFLLSSHHRFPSQRPGRTLRMGVEQGLGGAREFGPPGLLQWSGWTGTFQQWLGPAGRPISILPGTTRGRGSHRCSGSWLPRKGCQFHSPKHPVSCYTCYLCDLHSLRQNTLGYTLGRTYWSGFSSVQSLSRVWLFMTPWIAAHQASLSITNSRSLLKPVSIESVMPSNHLILCRPLLLLPSVFPSISQTWLSNWTELMRLWINARGRNQSPIPFVYHTASSMWALPSMSP